MVSGGMLVPPPGYLARLAAMARERGGLLVVNEVTTGGGRTGRWFAHQGQGIRPDLLTLGKAFGNGFPVAAVLVREQVEERAHEAGLTHVQSHGFDPFSGFLLATVIELVRAENLLHRASETGHRLRTYLEGVTERFPVTNVRGDGMLLAFDLDPNHVDFDAVARRLEDLRIVVAAQPAYHTIRLLPALVLGEEEIDTFTAGLETALRDST
jgi:4-aminobutyrate aminotransferase-like enzyme